jgi:hypothetical protein
LPDITTAQTTQPQKDADARVFKLQVHLLAFALVVLIKIICLQHLLLIIFIGVEKTICC